jgi:hypothetical protein
MYRLDYGVRRGRQKPVDEVKTGDRPIIVEGKPDDILLFGVRIGLGAYSAKLLNGTRHRLFGFSQPPGAVTTYS